MAVFPSAKAEQRLRTKMREMTSPSWGRSIASCMEGVSGYLTGWISLFRLYTPEAVQGSAVSTPMSAAASGRSSLDRRSVLASSSDT